MKDELSIFFSIAAAEVISKSEVMFFSVASFLMLETELMFLLYDCKML